jgi:hypothetical protein
MSNLIISLFLLFFTGCDTHPSSGSISINIAESKKRGVFISEYVANPNPYKINDTLQITVKEAWLEKRWKRSKSGETLLFPPEDYQLCIHSVEKDMKNICSKWTIGLYGDKYIRTSSRSSLIGDFKKIPGDTIEYAVQKGRSLSDIDEKIIIGKFVLIRKIN